MSTTSPDAKQAAEAAGVHWTTFEPWCKGYDAATAKLKEELASETGVAAAFDKLRSILRERSKGQVNTWSFVAMFMDMIDEAERAALSGTGEK